VTGEQLKCLILFPGIGIRKSVELNRGRLDFYAYWAEVLTRVQSSGNAQRKKT